jgi:hypothetical protein
MTEAAGSFVDMAELQAGGERGDRAAQPGQAGSSERSSRRAYLGNGSLSCGAGHHADGPTSRRATSRTKS